MSLSGELLQLYALDGSILARRRRAKRREEWMHNIFEKRKQFGEWSHLQRDLALSPEHYFKYFRLNKCTFNYILDTIKHRIERHSNFRETVSPPERLAVTLRYLATGSSFGSLSYSYRISDVTVGRIVHETCKVIWDCLHDVHMPFPCGKKIDDIVSEFWDKWKFPNCVGCIDGKHIRVNNPSHSGSMYYNHKKFFSIVLQGVVGANYKFICIDVGSYGKQSDSGVFAHSDLAKVLERGALNVHCEKLLPGSDIKVPHVIIGDGGFPLKSYLMRPYPLQRLTPEQDLFNKRLSHARQVVECTFGIISHKWRILLKAIEVGPTRAEEIVKCICLLHNIIIDKEGPPQMVQMSLPPTPSDDRFINRGENRSSASSIEVREHFKTYFNAPQQ